MAMAKEEVNLLKGFSNINVNEKDVNLLLLGETGVGKSTLINAFANYLEYRDFKTATRNEARCLIPSKFTVTDENFVERTVKIGKDVNENDETGASSTQHVRSYVFPYGKKGNRIRLIDCPGIGDSRGISKDNENFENILSYLGNIEDLHAICFLLKPNNSKATIFFEYCMKQLLSRLEKSASRNIIFIYTNSRSTLYQPGDTQPALLNILDQIKNRSPHVVIPYARENVFCMENESFRFLVACKSNIKFKPEERRTFASSWVHSVQECERLIQFVAGDDINSGLIPHQIRNTLCVNEARRLIIELSQPLADIAELVNDNITILEEHKNYIDSQDASVNELKGKLYVPVIELQQNKLSQPATVCTSPKCCSEYMVAGNKKYHYRQRCHDPCYLTNTPPELVGSSILRGCAAMSSDKCLLCGCSYSTHMHIYYTTEVYETEIEVSDVKEQIVNAENLKYKVKELIQVLKSRKAEYEIEQTVIVKTMAKFAHYFQHNSITPSNDAYKKYLEYLIQREKSLGPKEDRSLINYYDKMIKQYDAEKGILDIALDEAKNINLVSPISTTDIFQAVKTLYELKHTGEKIRELHNKQIQGKNTEYESNTEYLVEFSSTEQQKHGTSRNKSRNNFGNVKDKEQFNGNMKDKEEFNGNVSLIKSSEKSKYRKSSENHDDMNQNLSERNISKLDGQSKNMKPKLADKVEYVETLE